MVVLQADYLYELGQSSNVNLNIDTGEFHPIFIGNRAPDGAHSCPIKSRDWEGHWRAPAWLPACLPACLRLARCLVGAPGPTSRPICSAMSAPAGQNISNLDSLFVGNFLGHKSDIADGSLRAYEVRTLNNIVGDYYVAPRWVLFSVEFR